MPIFTYVAYDSTKTSRTGALEADDRSSAIESIKELGMTPISIKETKKQAEKTSSLLSFFNSNKVKSDDLVMFTRQLSAMISAGVPILRSLKSQRDHTDSPGLKKILTDVMTSVESGSSLADALAKYPKTFNDVYVNMIRAGESAGILDDILKRLALQQEKNATMRKKIKGAMAYPTVLLCVTVLAFFGLMLFIIPKIGNIFTDLGGPDAQLPLLTRAMLGISHFLIHQGLLLIPIVGVAAFLIIKWLQTPVGKKQFHTFVLKVPMVKTIVQKVAIARFSRTFSALMGAGVAVLESLHVTARSVGNVIYEEALHDAAEQVKSGRTLSSIIEQNPLFPAILSQMLAVGEETGQTDKVLIKVADFYEEEVDVAINSISSIIEPAMILIMGSMVGLIAASVMGPIAGLAQNIKG